MPEKYREICDKLGFDLSDYKPPVSDTEDDTHENPFLKLTGMKSCICMKMAI